MIGVFMTTLNRYRTIYNDLYKNGYPHGGLGFPITWSGINMKELVCLDIGCGSGVLGRQFKEYVGIDLSDYIINENKKRYSDLEFYCMDAKEIDCIKERFDIVIAIDVLEHFPEDEIEKYLKSISQLDSNLFLFSICCRPSGFRGMNGEELHTCIKTRDEWIVLLWKFFVVKDTSEMNVQKTFCVKAERL